VHAGDGEVAIEPWTEADEEHPMKEPYDRFVVDRLASGSAAARQVRAAIEEVLLGRSSFPDSWADAQARHQRLYRDRVTDLQFEG
jgi:hypothetical protein